MARYNSELIWVKSGSAVYVPSGSWNKRGGEGNKAYMVFSFFDSFLLRGRNTPVSNNQTLIKVKVYGESVYTPSSGRHKERECCPYSVSVKQGVERGAKTIETRSGSAVFVPEGTFNKRNGDFNKGYVRFSFAFRGALFVVKLYSQSTYVPSSGRHKDKNCCPVTVKKFKAPLSSGVSKYSRNWGGNPRYRIGGC